LSHPKNWISHYILAALYLHRYFIYSININNIVISDFPPTTFTQQPQAGSPEVQNNTKVLLCLANGLPSPVYRWRKDGKFTTSTNTSANSLRIPKVQLTDAGEYQCVASNAHGALLSNAVHVHVACEYH